MDLGIPSPPILVTLAGAFVVSGTQAGATLFQDIDAIDAAIGQIDQEVDAHVEPFRTAIEILSSIPGISDLSAEDQGQLSSGPVPTPPVGLSLRATPAYGL